MKRIGFFPFLLTCVASSLGAQQIRGRVLSSDNAPLDGVTIVMRSAGGQIVASGITIPPDGSFRLAAPSGVYNLRFERIGYAVHVQELRLRADTTLPELRLRIESIGLGGVEVGAASDESSASRRLTRAQLAPLQEQGLNAIRAIGRIPDVQVRRVDGKLCLESALRATTPGKPVPPCDPVLLLINGNAESVSALEQLSLSDIENIQYVPPKTAEPRYGPTSSRQGALIITLTKK